MIPTSTCQRTDQPDRPDDSDSDFEIFSWDSSEMHLKQNNVYPAKITQTTVTELSLYNSVTCRSVSLLYTCKHEDS